MKSLFINHIVKWGILAISSGILIADLIKWGENFHYSTMIMPIIIASQLRGILWEEGMRNRIKELEDGK